MPTKLKMSMTLISTMIRSVNCVDSAISLHSWFSFSLVSQKKLFLNVANGPELNDREHTGQRELRNSCEGDP